MGKFTVLVGFGGSPGRWRRLFGALALALAFAAGYWAAGKLNENAGAKLQVEQLAGQQSADELARLNSRLAIIERGIDVSAAANRRLRDELDQMEQALDASRADVDFYRRLLSAGLEQGLGVHELRLQRTASQRVFRFELTLALNSRRPGSVKGRVKLAVHGITADQPRTLSMPQLLADNSERETLDYEFRYFQQLNGDLVLPADFTPERLTVVVMPQGRGDNVEREFRWAELFAA